MTLKMYCIGEIPQQTETKISDQLISRICPHLRPCRFISLFVSILHLKSEVLQFYLIGLKIVKLNLSVSSIKFPESDSTLQFFNSRKLTKKKSSVCIFDILTCSRVQLDDLKDIAILSSTRPLIPTSHKKLKEATKETNKILQINNTRTIKLGDVRPSLLVFTTILLENETRLIHNDQEMTYIPYYKERTRNENLEADRTLSSSLLLISYTGRTTYHALIGVVHLFLWLQKKHNL